MTRKIWMALLAILPMASVLVGLQGCNKEYTPTEGIQAEKTFETRRHIEAWNLGFMSTFRLRVGGEFTYVQEWQADMLNATEDFGNRGGDTHYWIQRASDVDIRDVWGGYYGAIRDLNYFLGHVNEWKPKETGSEEEKKSEIEFRDSIVPQIVGNAHFLRAFYYRELAVRFSRLWNPNEDCVPLVTKYDVDALPRRNSQQEVYDFILQELDLAEDGLVKAPIKASSTIFNVDVVDALRARVYLDMENWAEAYAIANGLSKKEEYPLSANIQALANMWRGRDTESGENIMIPHVSRPDEPSPSNDMYMNIYAPYYTAQQAEVYVPDFLPSAWVLDLYEDGDFRKPIYFSRPYTLLAGGLQRRTCYVVMKYRGNQNLWTTPYPDGTYQPMPFRIAEQYLIAAEAAYKLGNEPEAKNRLNALRTARGLNNVTSSGDVLFKDIQDERTRELAFEGFRLWDLRRWGLDCKRHDSQDPSVLRASVPSISIELNRPNSDPHFVWGIPQNDILLNPNLVQNPGW